MHAVTVTDRVGAPLPLSAGELEEGVFGGAASRLGGLVRYRDRALRAGPVTLLRFGAPSREGTGWRWPIEGGLLARSAGGSVVVAWCDGRLGCTLEGYRPMLPGPIFRVTQLQVHRVLTRVALLDLRGRRPSPGMPAEPGRRLAAGAVDAAVCVALGSVIGAVLPRRGRLPVRALAVLGTAAAYHVACWSTSGRTAGGALAGVRVVSADGGRVLPGQALLRLLALPLALPGLRARHDAVAGTDVVAEPSAVLISRRSARRDRSGAR